MAESADRKVAFVTGAASGIGRATALRFAQAGYSVALADVQEAGLRETEASIAGGDHAVSVHVCDVASDESVAETIAAVLDRHGRLDAAFNAAGIDGEFGKFVADCSPDNWQRIIAVNLTGIWHCLRHEIPAMLRGGGGAIVNCASTAGIRGAMTCGAYSASKHGVVGLTKTAGLEYAGQGVRINAVCPGMIETPMTTTGGMKDLIADLARQTPLARLGKPSEIAEAVLWLCSDGASFVHGQAIPVDGALTSS